MKKVYELQNKLTNLQKQKKNYGSIENINFIQFLRYKKIISEEIKIKEQIKELNTKRDKEEQLYNSLTENWMSDIKINCRKYPKLEQKARYKRDKKLYKLGYTKERPVLPMFQNNSTINKITSKLKKINLFKLFHKKFENFRSNILPKKINKLAINSTKKIISGYRKFDYEIKYIQNLVAQNNCIKYLKSIKAEAVRQLDSNSQHVAYVNSLNPKNYETKNINKNKIISVNNIAQNNLNLKEYR